MKAQLWSINVCCGVIEISHGWSHDILEIHIPSANISVNVANDKVNFFRTYDGRYDREDREDGSQVKLIKEIDFPDRLVELLEDQLKSKEQFDKDIKELFDVFKAFSEELLKSENAHTIPQLTITTKNP